MTIDPAVEREQVDGDRGVARGARPTPRSTSALERAARGRGDQREPRAGDDRVREGGRHRRRVGGGVARRCSASTAPRPASAAVAVQAAAPRWKRCAPRCGRSSARDGRPDPAARRQARPRRPLERRRADRGRGPRRRASRSSTRASGSRRPRSRPPPATRTSTSWACRSCPARTSTSCPRPSASLRGAGVDAPVVVGGIIPDADRAQLEAMGVARVYTPKDYRLAAIMGDIAELVAQRRSSPQAGVATGR